MENKGGYFDTNYSVNGGRGSYETLFAMDPALFTPSTLASQDLNSHEDLDNILRGGFMDQLGSSSGMLSTGYGTWDAQGSAYSPYPDMSYNHGLPADQSQPEAGLGGSSIANGFTQSFPESNGEVKTVSYSDNNQPSLQIVEGVTSAKNSDRNGTTAKSAAKRKSDAGVDATDGIPPKPKKKRGPRKTKEKSEEEKRAKEERKLERNRMAASKCRQKKKVATEGLMENFNELERQNHFMKACLEEVKQDRNNVLALLLEHKSCGHPGIDKCLDSQLERIAGEFEDQQQIEALLEQHPLQSREDVDAQQFLNSNANSPSDSTQYGQSPKSMSRNDSISNSSISMSGSGLVGSRRESAASNNPNYAAGPENLQDSKTWPQRYTSGYQRWQQPRQGSSSSSSPETSMSRQNSSRTSVSEDHGDSQKNDSGISNVDTPPEERRKNLMDSPDDEAISFAAQENASQSRGTHMMQNQRLGGRYPGGPSDLQDPSVFLAGLTIPVS